MKQRRILLVSIAAVLGGSEAYLERLAAILAGKARLFALCVHPVLAERLRGHGVKVFQIPAPFGQEVQRFAKYPFLLFAGLWVLLRYRIQTVLINGYHAAFLIGPARLLQCHPLITPHHLPTHPGALRWYALNVRWVHCAINVSGVVDRQHRLLLPSVRTVVIPNWIPNIPDQFPTRRSSPTRQVLFVGRLVDNKGVPDLLRAIQSLNGEAGLIIAGEGPLRSNLEALAKGLPVRFVGYHPDLSQLYEQVDALVVPSHGPEGSCLVALEAMAHGLPCILSDLPVYKEIAQEGRTALLYAVGDSAALAKSIQLMINDRELGIQFARSAYSMVKLQYSADAAATAYLQIFGICAPPVSD